MKSRLNQPMYKTWMKSPMKQNIMNTSVEVGTISVGMSRLLQRTLPNTAARSDGWQSHHFLGGGSPVTGLTLASECATGCHAAAVLDKAPLRKLDSPKLVPPHPQTWKTANNHSYRSTGSGMPKSTTSMEGLCPGCSSSCRTTRKQSHTNQNTPL